MSSREIAQNIQPESCRDVRADVISGGHNCFDARHAVGRRHQGGRPRVPVSGNHHRFLAAPRGEQIAHGQQADLDRGRRRQRQRRGQSIGEWALRDDRGKPGVPRRSPNHVAATKGRAPDDHTVRVDPVEAPRMGDRGVPVLELTPHRQELTGLPGARTAVPVVEHQAAVAGGAETLGEGIEAHLAYPAETVGHHDDRPRGRGVVGDVQPRGAGSISRGEGHVRSSHGVNPRGVSLCGLSTVRRDFHVHRMGV